MQIDEATKSGIDRIFPLLPWAIDRMQTDIAPTIWRDLEPGTKATITHDIVMREGQRRFIDPQELTVAESRGLLHFVLSSAKLRVKRGDVRSLSIATNKTIQTQEWTHQLPLDGMADPNSYLHMVYIPDPFWARIARCVIGVYHGKMPRSWLEIDVDDWYANRGAIINPFARESETPRLTLKPGVIPLPLEESDGTS